MKKLEWFGYPMVKKSEDTIRLPVLVLADFHERDRRTDRQTPCDGKTKKPNVVVYSASSLLVCDYHTFYFAKLATLSVWYRKNFVFCL